MAFEINNINVGSGLTASTISVETLTGSTLISDAIYSGGTNIEELFVSEVIAGTNSSIAGTSANPIVGTVDSPSFNNISFSGSGVGGDFSATNLSGDTLYSGGTELTAVIDGQIEAGLSALTSSYFDAYDNVGGTTTTSAAWTATVPLNTQRQIGNDFSHSVSVSNDEVTINTATKYLVMGRVSAQVSAGTSRSEGQCRLEIDTGGGFVEVSGTQGELYLRLVNYGATASFQAVLDLEVGDKLRITFRRETGSDQVTLQAGGSSLTVAKVVGGQKGDKGLTGDLNLNGFTDFYVSGTTFSNIFSGNTQEAVYYGDGSNLTGLAMTDISYMIWAEENGSLNNGSRQWSFGNGSTGIDNVYMMYDAKITKMFIAAASPGTTATIDLLINDVAVATGSFSSNGIYTFPSPIEVFEGDAIGFETNTVTGSWDDVRTGIAVVNLLSGIKGDKGDTGNVEASSNFYVTGTTYSDVYSGNTQEAVYYGDGSNLTGLATDGELNSHITDTANPHSVTKTQVGLGNIDNTSDVNKPVSTAQASADTATLNSAKSYADGLVVGLWDDRGNYDASLGVFPSAGGSGTAGAVLKGDVWTINVAGTIGGSAYDVGDVIRALVDTPAQVVSNWAAGETNVQQATEIARGTAKLSTQAIIENNVTTNDIDIVTPRKFWFGITRFLTLAWTWALKQTFTTAPRFSSTTANQTLEVDANKDLVSVAKNTGYNLPKSTTAEINTGTEANKLITPDQLQGSKYLNQSGSKIGATASGTNTYTATIAPTITAYVSTQRFYIKFTNANTGAATLNLNGLGAKNLYKGVNKPLVSGDILAGQILEVAYDGTNFQMLSSTGTPGVITGALIFGGIITPPTLTGNVDNYNPTGLANTSFMRLNGGGSLRQVSGFQAPSPAVGQAIYIVNVGTTDSIRINDNDGGSLAANRILANGNILLASNESVLLVYDPISLRWRAASVYN